MAVPIDYTDLPRVSPECLMVAMRELVAAGRGLAPLRGIADGDLRALEDAIWRKLEGTTAEKVAALLRVRCTIGVFAAARLQRLFLHRGLALMQPAMEVAARMRLNVHLGFSPTKFVHALQERLQDAEQPREALPQRPAAAPARKSAWQLAAEARRRPAPVAVASVQQSPKQPEQPRQVVSPRPATAPARKSAWQLAAEARRRTAQVVAAPA